METNMKQYSLWWERPGGSYAEYEAAQKRVLEVFGAWKMPETLVFHQFVVRLGGEAHDLLVVEHGTTHWLPLRGAARSLIDQLGHVRLQKPSR